MKTGRYARRGRYVLYLLVAGILAAIDWRALLVIAFYAVLFTLGRGIGWLVDRRG